MLDNTIFYFKKSKTVSCEGPNWGFEIKHSHFIQTFIDSIKIGLFLQDNVGLTHELYSVSVHLLACFNGSLSAYRSLRVDWFRKLLYV